MVKGFVSSSGNSSFQASRLQTMETPGQRAATRPARVLIGWMTADEAVAALAGRRTEELERPEHVQRAEEARRAAALRRPVIGLDGVVIEPPAALQAYQATLAEQHPRLATLFEQGLRLALVDLRRVCALQSGVFTDVEVPDFDPDDLAALAGWTLRPARGGKLDIQFDTRRSAWTLLAPDPNIRVVRHFRTDFEEGAVGLGFEIRQFGSSLQAVRFRDRYVLVDGYHRAVALLSRGINLAPALVGAIETPDELGQLAVGLGVDVFLGTRPPLLPDFLDDEVAAAADLPVSTRMLVIEAMNLRSPG
jgi:hypothetical protein